MNIKSKQAIRIEQQFLHTFSKIIEDFPQYTISQHLIHFLRKKNEIKEAYYWSEELLLKKIENYYDELKNDLINTLIED